LLGGDNALSRLPDTFPGRSGVLPEIVFDGWMVNNAAMPVDPALGPVRLAPNQRNVSIQFAVIDLLNEMPLEVRCRLDGLDTAWVPMQDSRVMNFSHLRSGYYTFRVRVVDHADHPVAEAGLISFRIAPPIWQMPWFIALFLVVVAGAIAMYVRSRENRIRKAAALKQEMTELEMQALRAQMNPHFIFNCINSIDALVQGNDKYLATQYLNKFARLIRNVLDSSRQNLVPLAKDVETLRLYIDLEQFRHEGQFEVDLEVDPELLRGDYKVPPLVIQPFVENAILHGLRNRREPGGRLVIRIDTADGRLRYVVEDNGAGRQATMGSPVGERTSYGTRMSLDRIRLFNEEEAPSVTITDLKMDGRPAGTRVEAFLRMR
jgi:hypothetical protein